VYYRWHPQHGHVVPVCGVHCAAGERSYVVTLSDGTKTHLPVWMTEPGAADDVTLVEAPHVSVAALEAVRLLLDQARDSGKADGHP
jgi:hypothetical protein